MPIPASQASASNVEFTNGALRYRAHLVVENMELRVVDGEADGGLLGRGAERGNDAGSRDDGTHRPRSAAVIGKVLRCRWIRFSSPPRVSSTPLGCPVEPEV